MNRSDTEERIKHLENSRNDWYQHALKLEYHCKRLSNENAVLRTQNAALAPATTLQRPATAQRSAPAPLHVRSDKETGNCFRCHQPGHLIRYCPRPDNRAPPRSDNRSNNRSRPENRAPLRSDNRSRPDNRPLNTYGARTPPSSSAPTLSPTPSPSSTNRYASLASSGSEKGVRLG